MQDGAEIDCDEPFTLLSAHVCHVNKKKHGGTGGPASGSAGDSKFKDFDSRILFLPLLILLLLLLSLHLLHSSAIHS